MPISSSIFPCSIKVPSSVFGASRVSQKATTPDSISSIADALVVAFTSFNPILFSINGHQ